MATLCAFLLFTLFIYVCLQPNFTLTIQAWDVFFDEHDVIDVIIRSIPFPENTDKAEIADVGRNGIGWFNFTYYMQNLDSMTSLATPVPTMDSTCTCTTSVLIDNSSDQQQADSSSSPWAWIAVSTLFILLTVVFFSISVILVCVAFRAMKMKEIKKENTKENNGK